MISVNDARSLVRNFKAREEAKKLEEELQVLERIENAIRVAAKNGKTHHTLDMYDVQLLQKCVNKLREQGFRVVETRLSATVGRISISWD